MSELGCSNPETHATRECTECRTLQQQRWRAKKKAEEERKDPLRRRCQTCRMHYKVDPAPIIKDYNPIDLNARDIKWIENAARVFDSASSQRFTAEEFVAWLKVDVTERAA